MMMMATKTINLETGVSQSNKHQCLIGFLLLTQAINLQRTRLVKRIGKWSAKSFVQYFLFLAFHNVLSKIIHFWHLLRNYTSFVIVTFFYCVKIVSAVQLPEAVILAILSRFEIIQYSKDAEILHSRKSSLVRINPFC